MIYAAESNDKDIDDIEQSLQMNEYNKRVNNQDNNTLNDTTPSKIQYNELFFNKQDYKISSRKIQPNSIKAIDTKELRIHCHLDANNSRAFTLHVIMIYDTEQSNMLKSISVLDYFHKYKSLLRENMNSLSVFAMEIIPGKSYEPMYIPIKDNAILIDCMIFVCINDHDIKSSITHEIIASQDIYRKVLIGNRKKITLIINQNGAFLRD